LLLLLLLLLLQIEAVENHMPEILIVDEIGTEAEALACRTIAERGVALIGTAHGCFLENLIKNPTLSGGGDAWLEWCAWSVLSCCDAAVLSQVMPQCLALPEAGSVSRVGCKMCLAGLAGLIKEFLGVVKLCLLPGCCCAALQIWLVVLRL
jgi:hypothetical protein